MAVDRDEWLANAVGSSVDACLPYPWSKSERYVNTRHCGRKVSIHRLVCEMAHGAPQTGQVARHSCDDPRCCNPRHLSWGSQAQNIADAMDRGRFALGEAHGRAKLTVSDVGEIRRMFGLGAAMNEIARSFGISRPCVKQIVTRRTWAQVA